MKKRPEQHVIDEKAKKLFEGAFPDNFLLRSQDGANDYGIDYELEIFASDENGEQITTGILFKAQLKGAREAKKLINEPYITKSFEIADLHYWYEQLELPVILVLADLASETVYWTDFYSNVRLRKEYEQKKHSQSTITVYFHIDQVLPDTAEQLARAISSARERISLQKASSVTSRSLRAHFSESPSIDNEFSRLNDQIELLKLLKIQQAITERDFELGLQEIQNTLASNDASETLKINAILAAENVIREVIQEKDPHKISHIILDWQLQTFDKHIISNPNHSSFGKAFRVVLACILKLSIACELSYDLGMSLQIQSEGLKNNSQASLGTIFATANLNTLIVKDSIISNQISDALNTAFETIGSLSQSQQFAIISALSFQLVGALHFQLLRFQVSGDTNAATEIRNFFEETLRITFELHVNDGADNRSLMAILTRTVITLNDFHITPDLTKSKNIVNGWLDELSDPVLRTELKNELSSYLDEVSSLLTTFHSNQNQTVTLAMEQKALRPYLRETFDVDVDIDADDLPEKTDEMTRKIHWILKLGFDEHDPSEVLRHCKHLRVYLLDNLPLSPIARSANLWAGRMKSVCCIKKEKFCSSITWKLADSYEEFEKTHCAGCSFASPHSNEWQATHEWMAAEDEKVKKMLSKLREKAQSEDNK